MSSTVRVDDEQPAVDARVGDVVAGRYRLVRVLGGGGMGTVYEATHTFTHRRVAVKLVHRELASSPRAESWLAREARALALFDHAGIVSVLDGGRDADGTLYLVEAMLDGEDLARALAAQRMAPSALVDIALETLDALAAAHTRGLVHRDIKPENIFLARDPTGRRRVKLVDFGIVRVTEAHDGPGLLPTGAQPTQTGAIVGTPRFMSPEQARGEPVDARTDVWSLGAVMFFALTGQHAIEADNYNALIVRLATTSAPPIASLRPDLPAALASVVDRALARDLDARWPSAVAMADALRALSDTAREPEATPHASAPPPPAEPAEATVTPSASPRRPPWQIAAALGVGLALGLLAGAPLRRVTAAPPVVTRPVASVTPHDAAAVPDAHDAAVAVLVDAAAEHSPDVAQAVETGATIPLRVVPRRAPRRDEPIRQIGE